MSESTTILWEEELRGGQSWSHLFPRGTALRLTDLHGGANVSAMFYNADAPDERYNMPDTLKAQHIARLTAGFCLYSDMGRVLASITEDTCGWHDPIGGTLNARHVAQRFGERPYQSHRNDWFQNSRDGLLLELAKHGLGPRDLTPTLNLFSKVIVDERGAMHYVPGHSAAGAHVTLRFEMNVLVLLSANHHALDPSTEYAPQPVHLTAFRVPAPDAHDPCRLSRPENGRGFTLTERYAR